MKRPAFQFYPADWRKDVDLQSCSMTARGLWHELMCVMHECKPYGHLVLQSGVPPTEAQAARLVGMELREFKAALRELETVSVFSRLSDGTIYSRRMVKDEALRQVRADGGKAGAPHGFKGGSHGGKGGRPPSDKPPSTADDAYDKGSEKPPLNPPPSSSSSSSNGVADGYADARGRQPENRSGDRSPGKSKPPRGWHKTPDGCNAMGAWLGIRANPGETMPAYKDRLFAAIKAQEAPH